MTEHVTISYASIKNREKLTIYHCVPLVVHKITIFCCIFVFLVKQVLIDFTFFNFDEQFAGEVIVHALYNGARGDIF